MCDVNIKDYICNKLPLEAQSIALNFISFLEENGITFYKDNCDCWKNKIYYWCKYNNDCVCFISIKDPDEPQNLWTVWSDDVKSEWLENYDVDDNIKELAWKHVDYCGHCGSCEGGQHKVVFGREFKAVCGCTFRVDNPSFEDLAFLKKIIEMSTKIIYSAKKGKNVSNYVIEKLNISEYEKCNNIWNMFFDPHTVLFRKEIETGNRVVYIYKVNDEFLGEIAYVLDMNDSDYTIPKQRIYLSHLIVKPEYRNNGISDILVDFMIEEIRNMGYKEVSIGVDKDNTAALHLYRKKGFTDVIFDGADEYGEYYKLLKVL